MSVTYKAQSESNRKNGSSWLRNNWCYLPKGQTVNSRSYSDLLQNHLRPAIRSKRPSLLSKGVCLQQDNARSHTANATMMTLRHMKFKVLPHSPCSPDLASSDFDLFGPLIKSLRGRKFNLDDDVKSSVHEWLKGQPQEFFSSSIQALVSRWRKCFELQGDYFEL